MLEIVLATHNRDKVKEIKKLLEGLRIKILSADDFPYLPEVEENGRTLRENAIKKAREAAEFTGKIALADDSGLEVEAVNGAPGVCSARFAGENCIYSDNNRKLLRLMKKVPDTKRQATFKCIMALVWPEGKIKTVTGICRGIMARESRGKHGFGYDPVFIVPRYGKTFAELGLDIKNKTSHRAKALAKIRRVLKQLG
ncbi:MAG: XTP/dITP diphosphatase [bacterium]